MINSSQKQVSGPMPQVRAGTIDPDGDEMDFAWGVYPTNPEMSRKIVIEGRHTQNSEIVIAPELAGETVPILLTVTDRGDPKLTRYGRVVIKVKGSIRSRGREKQESPRA